MIKLLTPHPALLIINRKKALVVADLHLGFEFTLIDRGINIPSQMPKMRDELLNLIAEYQPDNLILMGDVKHNVPKISQQEWGDVPDLFEALQPKVDSVIVVRGNHDGGLDRLLPEGVKMVPSSGLLIDGIALSHGHAWPKAQLLGSDLVVVAHSHPTVSIRTSFGFRMVRRVWLRCTVNGEKLAEAWMRHRSLRSVGAVAPLLKARYNVTPHEQVKVILMPAFNSILGGIAANKPPSRLIGPIFRSGLVDMDKAELYLLDGTFLGEVGRLRPLA